MSNAVVTRKIDLSVLAARTVEKQKPAEVQKPVEKTPRKGKPLSAVLGAINNEAADRPVIVLPSGGERAIASVRVIPHIGFADITTVADLADGGKARTVRVPMNQPIVGWVKLPSKAE